MRRLLPLLFGVLAFAVSAVHAGRPSFWFDELATVSATDRSFGEMMRMLASVDSVHGLYYIVIRWWEALFGLGEWSLRLFSCLGVGAAVSAIVVLAKRLDASLAVPAGVVATVLPRVTWAGVEARSYAWVIAASALLLLCAVRAAERPCRRTWFAYGGAVALSVALFLYSGAVVLAAFLTIVWGRHRLRRPALIATGAGLLVISPLIVLSATQTGQVNWLAWPGWMVFQNVFVDQWFDHSVTFAVAAWVLVCSALWVGRGTGGPWRTRAALRGWVGRGSLGRWLAPEPWAEWAHVLRWAVPAALAPPILLLAVSTVFPMYVGRYVIASVPGVVLILAVAVRMVADRFGAHRSRAAVWAVLAALTACAVPGYLWQRTPLSKPGGSDFSYAARYIHDNARPGDCVLFQVQPSWSTTTLRVALEGLPEQFAGLKDIGDDGDRRTDGRLWDKAKGVNQWPTWVAQNCTAAWVLADADRTEDEWHRENGNLYWTFRPFQFMGSDLQMHLDDGGLAVVHQEQFHVLQVVHLEAPPPAVGPDPQPLPHTRHWYWR
ncbi:glycosyltransferase family 39 protein [Tsukamurella sp. 8F]|uniref:glycosyltransferase family 39 protein n=1 Tax=unclassified Tsukamurella TaxID=2633480 RepID=UPI0023B9D02D|nr:MULTISPECIES: glycosyltransferase family 39 protein [unclassified Tsukamurella]MDF0531806.1 glycosyltransferase family 39 protein [Tsukamurella sp. 8J]MDF0589048.1 glycosyltransferase family 39 protein [Tsukamurella sp. 8F]